MTLLLSLRSFLLLGLAVPVFMCVASIPRKPKT